MTQSTEQERAEFEAWCQSRGLETTRLRGDHKYTGEYFWQQVQDAWAIWQDLYIVGHAVPAAGPVQMPKEPTREMLAALLSPEEMSVVDMYKGSGVDALGIAIKASGVADRYQALLAAHGIK